MSVQTPPVSSIDDLLGRLVHTTSRSPISEKLKISIQNFILDREEDEWSDRPVLKNDEAILMPVAALIEVSRQRTSVNISTSALSELLETDFAAAQTLMEGGECPSAASMDVALDTVTNVKNWPFTHPLVREPFLALVETAVQRFGRERRLHVAPSGDPITSPLLILANYAPMRSPNQSFGTTAEPANATMRQIRSKLGMAATYDAMTELTFWIETFYERQERTATHPSDTIQRHVTSEESQPLTLPNSGLRTA